MANFDQNVTINLSVNSRGVQSKLAAAASEIKGVKESLDGLDSDLDSAGDSLVSFADAARRVDDTDLQDSLQTTNIEEEAQKFEKFANSLEKVSELKNEVADSNEALKQRNEGTSESTDSEAESFETLISQASSLSDAKDAVTNSNAVLDKQNDRTRRSILLEGLAMTEAGEKVENLSGAVDELLGEQENLEEQSNITTGAIGGENDATRKLADGLDEVEGAKKAASEANRKLGGDAEETSGRLQEEFDITQKEADALAGYKREMDEASNSTRSMTRSLKRMVNKSDESTDSMRAAAEVGDLFEDGLGSLSVNLGAFTIALRNFLTQVPLLLTALGALGAAALGAASAFVVLGGALAALVGVGALAHAKNLKSEYSQIEELGQSLEVIMRNVFDAFLQAIQPLLELTNITSFFKDAVEGTAQTVNMLSKALVELTEGSAQLEEFAASAGIELFTIQDAIDAIDGDSFRAVTAALMEAWVELGEEITASLGIINRAIARAISRSAELLVEVENMGDAFSQFGSTISELAELGFTIGSGLLPVFEAFSSIVESVASAINEMDDEMLANAITFAAIFAASSKVSGTLASIVTIIPSLVTGFKSVSAAASMANGTLSTFALTSSLVSSRVGSFLGDIGAFGGIANLTTAVSGLGAGFNKIAFNSTAANAKFKALAVQTDFTADQLRQLAIQGDLAGSTIDSLKDDADDLSDEARNAAISLRLTNEELESIQDKDGNLDPEFDVDDDETVLPDQFDVETKTKNKAKQILGMGEAADTAADSTSVLTKASNKLRSSNSRLASVMTVAIDFTKVWALSVKNLAVAAGTAVVNIVKMAGSALASYIPTTITSAFATIFLDGAITSLTAGLNKVIPAIIALIALLGGLAVGIFKNMGDIKSTFKDVFNTIKFVVGEVVDVLINVFLAVWDALKMTITPLLRPFKTLASAIGGTGDSAKESSAFVETLMLVMDALLGVITFTIRALGVLGKIITSVFILPFELAAVAIALVIDSLQFMNNIVGIVINEVAKFFGLIGDGEEDVGSLLDAFNILFEGVLSGFAELTHIIEDFINNVVIGGINKTISKLPGVNFTQVGEIALTRDEAGIGGDADVDAKKGNTITYNEDNSTNIDQTIDADPEDQAQLSRVVTDAIAEANSFERRRQGGQ